MRLDLTSAKTLAGTIGLAFLAPGLLGFIPNPIVHEHGVFAVNTAHNLVHILTACAFFLGAAQRESIALLFIRIGGIAYLGVAALGFLTSGDMLLGFIHINQADRWLHLGLAIAILAVGFAVLRPKAA